MLHYGRPGTGLELEPGMTFTIEPMINAGKARHPRARRRLDHRHQGPLAVGAVGAHGARHRDRLRGADALGRRRRRRRRFVALTPCRRRSLAGRDAAAGAARSALRSQQAERAARSVARVAARAACCAARRRVDAVSRRLARRRPARRRGARRRRRLRPRRAVPALRRRRAGPARRRDPTDAEREARRAASSARCWDIGLEIGHSVRTVAGLRRDARPTTSRCGPACSRRATSPAAATLFQQLRARAATQRSTPARVLRGEDARAGAAPRQVPGHALHLEPNVRRARAACATCRSILWIARAARPRPHAGASSVAQRPDRAPSRRASSRATRRAFAGPAHPPALPRRPARGPPGVRPADRARRAARLRRHARRGARASADAALLPGGQGGDAAQQDPAAEHRGAARARSRRRRAPINERFQRARRAARGRRATTCSSASRARSSRASC